MRLGVLAVSLAVISLLIGAQLFFEFDLLQGSREAPAQETASQGAREAPATTKALTKADSEFAGEYDEVLDLYYMSQESPFRSNHLIVDPANVWAPKLCGSAPYARAAVEWGPKELVPIVVSSLERARPLNRSIGALRRRLLGNYHVFVVDEGSKRPDVQEMLAWLATDERVSVHPAKSARAFVEGELAAAVEKMGHTYRYVVVTDPETELQVLGDMLALHASMLDGCPEVRSVGPALWLTGMPEALPNRDIIEWSEISMFSYIMAVTWKGMLLDTFPAPITDSWRMFRASDPKAWEPSTRENTIRTGVPYAARHLPWFTLDKSPDELAWKKGWYANAPDPTLKKEFDAWKAAGGKLSVWGVH